MTGNEELIKELSEVADLDDSAEASLQATEDALLAILLAEEEEKEEEE